MDSHSRSASPREPMRPQHRPPSPPSSPGLDNKAYEHDESDPNHNDSFTSNGPQNGHSKEPNGVDTKTLEAVNLELINLTPKNGNAKQKKDVEVDMNAANPYDEYFVPVNEHRKYMRGEKLYVTADKRGEKGGCKRPLCWTLLGLVVAAIVAVIVLAATGVLFTNSPTPLEQYNTTVSSARALGAIGHGHSSDHDHSEHDHSQHDHSDHGQNQNEYIEEQNTQPSEKQGTETQSDERHEQSIVSDDAGDSAMYVPRTVEGELKVDNEEFTAALQDPESSEYKEFLSDFTDGLKRALFNRNELENGDNDIIVEVVQLRKGSVLVTYRIHWKPKANVESSGDLLNPNTLETKLNDYLATNNRMISIYHISEDKMATRKVFDICQINKNGCEHECEFDETTLEFTCTCPHGQILHMPDMKRCIPILETPEENEAQDKQKEFRVLTIDEHPNTTRTLSDEEKPATESVHISENTFDWKEMHHTTPEMTTKADADVNFSHIFGHTTDKHSEVQNPEFTVEPKYELESTTAQPQSYSEHLPEPTPEPESVFQTELEPNPVPEPEPEPEPEPNSQLESERKSETELEPKAEPEPQPEPKSEPAPVTEMESEQEPNPKSEPAPEPTGEPEIKPESDAEEKSVKISELLPTSSPPLEQNDMNMNHNIEIMLPTTTDTNAIVEPESTSDSKIETETPQITPIKSQVFSGIHSIVEPEIIQTTEHEQELESESISEESSPSIMVNKNSNTDLTTSDEASILYTNEGKFEYKPVTLVPEVTTMRIPTSEPNIIDKLSYEPKPEIISILSDKKTTENEAEVTDATTENNEWLEDHSSHNDNVLIMGTNINDAHNKTYEDIINNKVKNKVMQQSEQRSFKSFDEDFMFETTTTTIKNLNEEILLNKVTKEEEPVTDNLSKLHEETTMSSVTMFPIITTEKSVEKEMEETTTGMTNEVSVTDSDMPKHSLDGQLISENSTKTEPIINSIIEEAKSLHSNKVENITTTLKPDEPATEMYSIVNQLGNTRDDKLMEVLENKDHSEPNKPSTENDLPEGMEVTFDDINKLYNRSSKSIENEPDENTTKKDTELINETVITTDSDWLSEPVTEVTYNEAMNKMEKNEITEATITKTDDVIPHGLSKEDFEPDYLNNMSNNKAEQDVPLYGMVQDYDNDDTRFKRVNKEGLIETTTKIIDHEAESTKINSSTEANINIIEMSFPSSFPNELTTVSDYIYKSAEKNNIENEDTLLMHNQTESPISPLITVSYAELDNNSPSPVESEKAETTILTPVVKDGTESIETSHLPSLVVTAVPAPVWEESDSEKYISMKELPKKLANENNEINQTASIQEIQSPIATIITTTTVEPILIVKEKGNATNTNVSEETENSAQNLTQLNNLNVTIYEISGRNNSLSVMKPANTQSAEYEDHEPEMNPFLPEVENNKSLVKKLQEGHDIEPINLNETQNENAEEHSISPMESHIFSSGEAASISSNLEETKDHDELNNTDDDSSYNELLHKMSINTNSNETEAAVSKESKNISSMVKEKTYENTNETQDLDIIPISTFLLDTEDLINNKEQSSTFSYNSVENGNPNSTALVTDANNDNEYLSVVPITEEKEELEKEHQSENLEELNNISDLPKKSNERTIDSTKLQSVNNNEALVFDLRV